MRRKDREVTNIQEIAAIVEKAKILHLGIFDGDYPYVVPLHFGYEMTEDKFVFYMHSAKEGHKLDAVKKNPNVCIELETDVNLVSGDDVPCMYGAKYGSFIGKGTAELVDNEDEKIKGLKLLMKNQTGKDFEIDGKMADAVELIKVNLKEFTAKARRK